MTPLAVRVTPRADRQGVIAALFDAGVQGLHEDGDSLVTSVPDDIAADVLRRRVATVDPRADIDVSIAPSADLTEWRGTVRAHTVGAITVAPPWVETKADGHVVIIEPAMAFGTGEHATTRLCLSLLQQTIRAGDTVADLGAGSAVLSIAAAKLGARSVAAVELDPDATSNAEENVQRNGVGGIVRVIEGDAAMLLPLIAPVRLVIANILTSVILEMLPVIARSLTDGGEAIFSGILREERDAVVTQLEHAGWRVKLEETEDEWWSCVAVIGDW